MSTVKRGWSQYVRLLLPTSKPVTALVGGVAGLAGDLATFVTGSLSQGLLLILFLMAAAGFVALCFTRVGKNASPEHIQETSNCWPCDGARLSLFAAAVFALLMVIGQGESGLERMTRQLTNMEGKIDDIHESIQSNTIIKNPKTADQYYSNAFVYSAQRNAKQAAETLDQMYSRFNPKKLDGAELYYSVNIGVRPRSEVMASMVALGERLDDGNFLVVAARHAADSETGEAYLARARAMQPDLPFAYYDIMNSTRFTHPSVGFGDSRAVIALEEEKLAAMDAFIERIDAQPLSQFYFVPQWAGDPASSVRTLREIQVRLIETYRQSARVMQGSAIGRETQRRLAQQAASSSP